MGARARLSLLGVFWLGVFCVALIAAQALAQANLWEEHINAGVEAYQLGDNREAEKQFFAAVGEAEKFGPEDPRLAQSLNNLAGLYNAQGKYAEAEPLYRRHDQPLVQRDICRPQLSNLVGRLSRVDQLEAAHARP